jgi:flagellar hook-associated protein 1 FlgK
VRNKLLDELSLLVDVSYREDASGTLLVSVENVPFVIKGDYLPMGTMQAEPFSNLVIPSWPHLKQAVFNFDNPIGPEYDNDIGKLKGLILARGTRATDYTDLSSVTVYNKDIKESAIMRAQAQFDNLIHGIVTMVNNIVSPNLPGPPATLDIANAPYGLNGTQGIEIFSRKNMDRYDSLGNYNEEDPNNLYSLYSAGNIRLNPQVLADYNKIALSQNPGYDGDSQVVSKMLKQWDTAFSTLEPGSTGAMTIREYYTGYVATIGNMGYVAKNQASSQSLMATQINNQRNSLTGVSSDEELGNMMKYQHAYNAAARVVTTVDKMIEQIVTSMGLVGR